MFESIFKDGSVAAVGFFIVLGASLISGLIYAFLACYKSDSSTNFFICAALIPMAVAAVIALVNGNLGVGVAIAGAFGLVRFRSAPGSAREIAVIFMAMAAGLAFGMGYIAYGAIFLLVCGVLLFAFGKFATKAKEVKILEKIIRITIPETLDYTDVFDDIFDEYTDSYELEKVKSTNMGSMFRLSYRVKMKKNSNEKTMLDAVRERNGNLEIQCLRADLSEKEL
mgnify:CR=1 FL=1